MITINLLPIELRPVKRTPILHIASGTVLVLIVLGIAFQWINNQRRISNAAAQLEQDVAELQELQEVVTKYNELSKMQIELSEKVNTINEIAHDRIVWSEQLYHLARLALKNFWYDSIRVGTKSMPELVITVNPETKETTTQRVTRQAQVLTVSGFVTGGAGSSGIAPFMIATEQDERFSRTFVLDLIGEVEDTLFEEQPVRKFELVYLVKPGGSPR